MHRVSLLIGPHWPMFDLECSGVHKLRHGSCGMLPLTCRSAYGLTAYDTLIKTLQAWLRKSKAKEQEEYGSDDESKPKRSRKGSQIEIVGHKRFSMLSICHTVSCL